MTRISKDRSRAIFNYPSPPAQVSEYQFDGFDDELFKLAQSPWDKINDEDLWYYLHDLAYVELQPDLFAYLFPVCLNFWYQTLMRNMACAQGDAEFHYALLHGQVLQKMVTPTQQKQIFTFFYEAFLDRLDQERDFSTIAANPHAFDWIMRFNSLGLVIPLTEQIWNSWWSISSCGQAVSALVYLSCLMYESGENPIFKAWTRNKGGGRYLWENDSYIFDQGWLPTNLDFLRRTLTIDYLGQKVKDACQRLAHEPEAELADKICKDYDRVSWAVEIRIEYLLEHLEARNPVYYDW